MMTIMIIMIIGMKKWVAYQY